VSERSLSARAFNTRDLLLAQPWSHVFFTTYAMSLSFVEAVMLEALSRSRSKPGAMTILVDAFGLKSALSETGARKIGRDYLVEPVLVKNGIFHPKIGVLGSPNDEIHLIVGSGNLTFGGWGGNLECVEHLHPSFAASAFRDAAIFLESVASNPRLTHGAADACMKTSALLLKAGRTGKDNGQIRILHSLETPILAQVANYAADLGGAQRLTVMSPYFDGGAAIQGLANQLGLSKVHIHNHPAGAVKGSFGTDWPHAASAIIAPVNIQRLSGSALDESADRLLHAKMFEIVCAKGRIVIAGSANATMPALGDKQNVEVCVLRILPKASESWVLVPCLPPSFNIDALKDVESRDDACGVLRATAEGDMVTGQALSPKPRGRCRFVLISGDNTLKELETIVEMDGTFTVVVPDLMNEFFNANRIVIELTSLDTGYSAKGFLSISGYNGVMGRLGKHGRVIADFLSGHDAPGDAVLILEWALQNLSELAVRFPISSSNASDPSAPVERLITRAMLDKPSPPLSSEEQGKLLGEGAGNWQRFIDSFLVAIKAKGNQAKNGDITVGPSEDGGPEALTEDVSPKLSQYSQSEKVSTLFETIVS
jgi:hypothetical protein